MRRRGGRACIFPGLQDRATLGHCLAWHLPDGPAPALAGRCLAGWCWLRVEGVGVAGWDGAGEGAGWRVFVSHTAELRDYPPGNSYVAAAERAISAAGHVIVDMADFPAADQVPARLCADRVRGCQVYVGVLGTRYGSPVRDKPEVSYTELEFQTATEAGLDRLVFVLDEGTADVGLPVSALIDREFGARQDAFRRRVREGGLVTGSFASPAALGQLVERSLRDLAARQTRTAARSAAGRLIAEVTDPFALEVHRPVQPGGRRPGLPVLPPYVAREHDRELAGVVRAAAEGSSGIAVLVGGSSTGKTRACWEALGLLRDLPQPWRLWHPIDPSRPEAALRELGSIGPRTVVWLNEAQLYLDAPAGGLGEQVAAGLRELLRDPARAPVLVLATLWPQFWDILTARPAVDEDRHAQARELLAGRYIGVPAAFTPAQVRQLTQSGDPRLALAAATADGQVVQFLAGAPELLARYRNAPPAAAALISAAIDARRLGMGLALPRGFLEASAPGYLTDSEWDWLGEDWLEQALAYTAAPCKGVRGPLTRIRPHPAGYDAEPGYQLAVYLDQHGRRTRRAILPPAEFWAAAARFASLGELPALAEAAENRGLLRDAAGLRKHAAARGDAEAAALLVRGLHLLHPADQNPARWAAAYAALDDPSAVAGLLGALREAGADHQVAALLARDPAAHAALDDPSAVAGLLGALREAGADHQVAALLARDLAAHAALDDPSAVAGLLGALREAGADHQVAALLARDPAAHAALDDPSAVAGLLGALREAGADHQVAALLARDPAAHAALDDPSAVAGLREAGADHQVAALLARDPAAHAALDDPSAVAGLLGALREAGADHQVAALLARDPAAHAALDDPSAVAGLLGALREAGADDQVGTLVDRLPAEGLFGLFCEQTNHQVLYRFGREPDGTPASSWGWDDLYEDTLTRRRVLGDDDPHTVSSPSNHPDAYRQAGHTDEAIDLLNVGRQVYGSPDNLFDARNALIDDRFFFGRDAMLARIDSAIRRDEHVLISGLRKSGKTSLLNVLRQQLTDYPVCLLDLQRFDRHAEDWPPTLFAMMVEAVDRWGRMGRAEWPFASVAPTTATELGRELDRRFAHLGTNPVSQRLVVMLDEIERVFPRKGEVEATRRWVRATGALRALAQGSSRSVVIIGADVRPTINRDNDLGNRETNPFFSFFQELPVALLDHEATDDMLRSLAGAMGVTSVSKAFVDQIFALTGGHPSLARTIAAEAYRQRRALRRLDEADLESSITALHDTDSIGSFVRSNLWQPMTAVEREIVSNLSHGLIVQGASGRGHLDPDMTEGFASLRSQGIIGGSGVRVGLLLDWVLVHSEAGGI